MFWQEENCGINQRFKGKITVILTTHYLEEAESLSDRIGIMVKGNLVAEGTADELKNSVNATFLKTLL